MPEAADQPATPRRTFLPMALCTAGILLALGLAWFIGAVAVPYVQVRAAARASAESEEGFLGSPASHIIDDLGGPERAAARLRAYVRMPKWMAEDKHGAMDLLGCCGRPAVPALIEALGSADGKLREVAAWNLGSIGPEAREAIPALKEARGDSEGDVRGSAAWALAEVRAGPAEAVPVLVRALGDPNLEVRRLAAQALGKYGPEARAAIPALQAALQDKDSPVRAAAAEALKKIRGEEPTK